MSNDQSRPMLGPELEAAIAEEMISSQAGLDDVVQEWRRFRDEWSARYPHVPSAGLLAMFCVALHDEPENNPKVLAAMLAHAIWRIDVLTS